GARWAGERRARPGLLVVLAALLAAGCAAAPAALAAPDGSAGLPLSVPASPVVVINWEHWVPLTPRRDEATYDLALSCSDGTWFRQFREAFQRPAGGIMPSGNAGPLGATDVSCADWSAAYLSHRATAGLPIAASLSWDGLDVRA